MKIEKFAIMNFDKKKLIIFLSICVLFIIVLITYFSMSFYIPTRDDHCATILNEVYHGKYIVSWLPPFIGYLGSIFKVQYIYWLQTGGAVIKGIIIAALCYYIASTAYLEKEKNLLFPFFIFINFLLYSLYVHTSDWLYTVESYTSCSYYVFGAIFFVLFWQKFAVLLLKQRKIDNKEIIVLCMYAFILGFVNDFVAISTLYSLLILFILKKQFSIYKYRHILLLILCLFSSFLISIFNINFIRRAYDYGAIRPIKLIIEETFMIFNDFNIEFLKVFMAKFMILFIIIAGLYALICFFIKEDKNTKKSMLFLVPILLSSVFLFYYTLILVGTSADTGSIASLWHSDLILEMQIILTFIIFLEIGFLYRKKLIVYYIFITLFITGIVVYYSLIIDNIRLINDIGLKNYSVSIIGDIDFIKKRYIERYIQERILSFYIYKGITPIMYCVNEKDKLDFDFRPFSEQLQFLMEYKYNSRNLNIICLEDRNAMIKVYQENGGPEIKEEEINEPNFSLLTNQEFVLYGRK